MHSRPPQENLSTRPPRPKATGDQTPSAPTRPTSFRVSTPLLIRLMKRSHVSTARREPSRRRPGTLVRSLDSYNNPAHFKHVNPE